MPVIDYNSMQHIFEDAGAGTIGSATVAEGLENGITGNKDFERNLYMSNTAHQREVADLQAAGLNPYLSTGGSAASTPTSNSSSSSAHIMGSIASMISQGMKAAVGADIAALKADNVLKNTLLRNTNSASIAENHDQTLREINQARNESSQAIAEGHDETALKRTKLTNTSKKDVTNMYINANNELNSARTEERTSRARLNNTLDELYRTGRGSKSVPEWYSGYRKGIEPKPQGKMSKKTQREIDNFFVSKK